MSSLMNKARVLVIGAGVSGVTTALCLRQKGMQVTVVAEKLASQSVSVVAGALWEWPPAVCGFHQDQQSLERSKQWCMVSYETRLGRLTVLGQVLCWHQDSQNVLTAVALGKQLFDELEQTLQRVSSYRTHLLSDGDGSLCERKPFCFRP